MRLETRAAVESDHIMSFNTYLSCDSYLSMLDPLDVNSFGDIWSLKSITSTGKTRVEQATTTVTVHPSSVLLDSTTV